MLGFFQQALESHGRRLNTIRMESNSEPHSFCVFRSSKQEDAGRSGLVQGEGGVDSDASLEGW